MSLYNDNDHNIFAIYNAFLILLKSISDRKTDRRYRSWVWTLCKPQLAGFVISWRGRLGPFLGYLVETDLFSQDLL